jgi:hypothetical protein
MQVRKRERTGQSEEQSELRAEHQQGRKQSARRSRRIRERAKREAQQENRGQHGERSRAKQRSLRDRIAAADQIGKGPGERADRGANQRRPRFDRHALYRRHGLQQHPIVDYRDQAGASPENEEQRAYREVRHDQSRQMEILPVAQNRAGDRDGAGRGAERRDRHPQFEAAHQFLEHENGAGDRRVERSRKAGPGACSQQHAAIGPIAPEGSADEMAESAGHVHARPLAAERQSGADCERAADEFYWNDAKRRLRHLPLENGFDLRNAAAGRLRRHPANE